ncbi:MAG TPA: hypothetical protein VG934_00685 [Candidatus Paceibacterota bacterium]|nr:hypothetical protein [Candidatus Paceibacterota bacterium]
MDYLYAQEAQWEQTLNSLFPTHWWEFLGRVEFWIIAFPLCVAWIYFSAKLAGAMREFFLPQDK